MKRKTIQQAREALAPFARLFADVDTSHLPDDQRFVVENVRGRGSCVRSWSGSVCGFTVAHIKRVKAFVEP